MFFVGFWWLMCASYYERRLPTRKRTSMHDITPNDVSFFREHGAVCLRKVLAPNWVSLLAQGFEKNLASPSAHACFYTSDDAPGLFRDDYCNWTRIDEFRQVIFNSNLAAIAATLLEASEIRIFHDHIFYKKSGTVKKTPWHQDLPYYCVDGDQGLSFWIPLGDIDESNKIEFIAGSHRWGKLFMPTKFNGVDHYDVPTHLYETLPDLDAPDAAYTKLSWTMEVGDVLAFDFRTIHGNTKTPRANLRDRRSVALRFLGEHMRYSARPGEKSPPFPNLTLVPNAPLEHPLFPVVWSRNRPSS